MANFDKIESQDGVVMIALSKRRGAAKVISLVFSASLLASQQPRGNPMEPVCSEFFTFHKIDIISLSFECASTTVCVNNALPLSRSDRNVFVIIMFDGQHDVSAHRSAVV